MYAADQPNSPNPAVTDGKAIIYRYTASLNLQNHRSGILAVWYKKKKKRRIRINQSKIPALTLRIPPCPVVSMDIIQIPSYQSAKYLGISIDSSTHMVSPY